MSGLIERSGPHCVQPLENARRVAPREELQSRIQDGVALMVVENIP